MSGCRNEHEIRASTTLRQIFTKVKVVEFIRKPDKSTHSSCQLQPASQIIKMYSHPSKTQTPREEKRQYQLIYMADLRNLYRSLLGKAPGTSLAATNFAGMPVDFHVRFVVLEDGGSEISLTRALASRVGGTGPISGEMVDRCRGTTRWEKRRHRCVRQLLEREEPTTLVSGRRREGKYVYSSSSSVISRTKLASSRALYSMSCILS